MKEIRNTDQIRDTEILARIFSQETTKDQDKSRILVLMASAFQSGMEAGAAAAGFEKDAEARTG